LDDVWIVYRGQAALGSTLYHADSITVHSSKDKAMRWCDGDREKIDYPPITWNEHGEGESRGEEYGTIWYHIESYEVDEELWEQSAINRGWHNNI
jgi:hypothetical protein